MALSLAEGGQQRLGLGYGAQQPLLPAVEARLALGPPEGFEMDQDPR